MVQFKLKSVQDLSIPDQANLVAGMSHTCNVCTCTCKCGTKSTDKATKNATGNTLALETQAKTK